VCIYEYVCKYICKESMYTRYIHTYVYIYTHICINIYIHIHIQQQALTPNCISANSCRQLKITLAPREYPTRVTGGDPAGRSERARARTIPYSHHIYVCSYVQIYTHKLMHKYMYVYVYTYIYIYIYIYV
jgi:hypothetical protein